MNDKHYVLLTPGPLTTTETVKRAMLRDWCTWDAEYNELVQDIRYRLVSLAAKQHTNYTSVLMQGSGTFAVESVIGSVIPREGKLLVCVNGAYGARIVQMAEVLQIPVVVSQTDERMPIDVGHVEKQLKEHSDITHVAIVHCETTTGMLNPVQEICALAKQYGKITIVDAMSSFGGIPMEMAAWQIDFLISSANKCIQGVPGFGFVIAKQTELAACKGRARSLSLDLYDQWNTMEQQHGKWRFTSPTHVVRAFYQALLEIEEEGGIIARHARYTSNQQLLVQGMKQAGFNPLLKETNQSPIITAFCYPPNHDFEFKAFYNMLKQHGFVIYPGKISQVDTFRIGTIGDVHVGDIKRLTEIVTKELMY